mmetsp:Transcript_9172/g.21572  ORF Transcript_9172/g.21572 Transcript_9172/m.21572 type:complete len:130 (-) Transcript_9172:3-392(-)
MLFEASMSTSLAVLSRRPSTNSVADESSGGTDDTRVACCELFGPLSCSSALLLVTNTCSCSVSAAAAVEKVELRRIIEWPARFLVSPATRHGIEVAMSAFAVLVTANEPLSGGLVGLVNTRTWVVRPSS